MSQGRCISNALVLCLFLLVARSAFATTWYVRPDGGTRYSSGFAKDGQCDGKTDAAYRGSGTNQHCAFKDVRSLWTDGTYCTDSSVKSTCWKWIGTGGDTYILRGSLGTGVSYRVGQSGPMPKDYFGLAGSPYGAGAPPPPSGTPGAHTRILGENYGSCSEPSARTQLHGGYGVGSVLNMQGVSYVELACLDITDFSACGRAAQKTKCSTDFPLSDYANTGISWNNRSTNDTVIDVRIHGMASVGMKGPTGDHVEMTDLDLIGNAASGWDADPGDGTTGTGSLSVKKFNISWNGCAEEYPLAHPLPYGDCTDDNGGGYGDGFGTATVPSQPGWQAHFDDGVVSYNTQDGLDALHLIGSGSSMTITNVLAYGNMGQQIKVGGAAGTAEYNRIFTNCNAMRMAIPGTPPGYNTYLSDFCRAADGGVVMTVGDGSTTVFSHNILYSASSTALEVEIEGKCVTATCLIRQQYNTFIGFRNNAASGYTHGGGTGDYSNPIYADESSRAYKNAGSTFDHNTTFHAKSNWKCPAVELHEKNARCADPHLADETWHLYGYADTTPTQTPSQADFDSIPESRSVTRSVRAVSASLACVALVGFGLRRRRQPKRR